MPATAKPTRSDKQSSDRAKKRKIHFTFKAAGLPLTLKTLPAEFRRMAALLDKPVSPEIMKDVGEKSGTHLLKMISPRTPTEQSVLRIETQAGNRRPPLTPSHASLSLYGKLVFRPLEIRGQEPRSIVDHIRNPCDISDGVLAAFGEVFGEDSLEALRASVTGELPPITSLPGSQFPVIFAPRPGGGDLQITPLAPVEAYMEFKSMAAHYFQQEEKQAEEGKEPAKAVKGKKAKEKAAKPKFPRGRFTRQVVSSKMQNITSAIGGPRQRFRADMPAAMAFEAAEIHRFVMGGSFPRLREADIDTWVLRYADFLDTMRTVRKPEIVAAADRIADRLVHDAVSFIHEILGDARELATRLGKDPEKIAEPPAPARVLLRRRWPKDTYDRARRALTSEHYRKREAHVLMKRS